MSSKKLNSNIHFTRNLIVFTGVFNFDEHHKDQQELILSRAKKDLDLNKPIYVIDQTKSLDYSHSERQALLRPFLSEIFSGRTIKFVSSKDQLSQPRLQAIAA